MTLYRKVMTADRLPDKEGAFLTNIGIAYYNYHVVRNSGKTWGNGLITYWLEKIDIPSDKEIKKMAELNNIYDKNHQIYDWCCYADGYEDGFKKCLEILTNKK